MSKSRSSSNHHRTIPKQWMYIGLAFLAILSIGMVTIAMIPKTSTNDAGKNYEQLLAAQKAKDSAATASRAAATPSPLKIAIPKDPHLLIVGDSYTAGVGADSPTHSWANLVADKLGYPFKIDGVGGTGFAWGGGTNNDLGRQYSVRLKEIAQDKSFVPNILILQGGQNDSLLQDGAKVTKAVADTVAEASGLWPGIQIVVLGPSAPEPLATDLTDTNAAVRDGSAAAKVPFINAASEHWLTAQNSSTYHFDGAHVNTAGHRFIADKFLASWATIAN